MHDKFFREKDLAKHDNCKHQPRQLLICRGLLYHISNSKIVPAHGAFNPIDTDKTIIFEKRTTIKDCPDRSSVPQFKFGLSSWPQILSRMNTKKTLTGIHLFHTVRHTYNFICNKRMFNTKLFSVY